MYAVRKSSTGKNPIKCSFTNLFGVMLRLLLQSLMRGDTREPRAIIEANSWYLIRDPESIKASHTLLQVAFT
jgi:hypothetical protein